MANRGGRRENSGRKKGSGLSNFIKNRVDEMLFELLKNDEFKQKAQTEVNRFEMFSGWIYIIRNKQNGYYKVGITQSQNPNGRFSLYRTHDMDIELIFIESVDNCREIEEFIHSTMNEFRHGTSDWYKLNADIVLSVIKTINKHKYPNYGRW